MGLNGRNRLVARREEMEAEEMIVGGNCYLGTGQVLIVCST